MISFNKNTFYSLSQLADILSLPKRVLETWQKKGNITPLTSTKNKGLFSHDDLILNDNFKILTNTHTGKSSPKPLRDFTIIELFAGGGGLALGLENAGFKSLFLNEIDKHASNTLKKNRPDWNVANDDISNIDFTPFHNKVDLLTGGFPCQAFSYAGKKLGFEDTRGTLFFEYARAVKEVNQQVIMAENVKGLLGHDN